jgi:hypothetical protein
MAGSLPLLVFPQARRVTPEKGSGGGGNSDQLHLPGHGRQVDRLIPQLQNLQQDFTRHKANIDRSMAGLEPETVLVIQIAGSVEDFKRAVDATEGLEWLGEWDMHDIEPDDDFYDEKTDKLLSGRLFVSMLNEQGLNELLSLWRRWEENEELPWGKTKWRDVFNQTQKIRPWGFEETLYETGMVDRWRELTEPINPDETVHFQIECFYRRSDQKRLQNQQYMQKLLSDIGGDIIGQFIDIEEIAFHAAKASLPARHVQSLLQSLDAGATTDMQLFLFRGVMHFRPTGQSIAFFGDETGLSSRLPDFTERPESAPVAAMLDGAPNLQHDGLKDRLLFDDPDNLAAEYQPGQRKHGTAMASLIVHGDLSDTQAQPLSSPVYCIPVMQPNPEQSGEEYFPPEIFFEDRIERAVRRIFDGEENTPAQAPTVKIINLSIGDPARPFIHTLSPWARLLDWLAWKYRVLFCVSTGNFTEPVDLKIAYEQFARQIADEKADQTTLQAMQQQLFQRRLLSPAESINTLTVGALHLDESGDYDAGRRIDLLPNEGLCSPVSRMGHGFHRSVKPEILFPGGRQLYNIPHIDKETAFSLAEAKMKPGQQVAWDSAQEGELSQTLFTRGTSNATALATRAGVRIHEMLTELGERHGENIPDELTTVLIKTLLVHGAKQGDDVKQKFTDALKHPGNSRYFKSEIARYMGYGAVDIERVLACTEQRATVLGSDEIKAGEIHEYRFPLPKDLSGYQDWRCMVITLAWFSPINPMHRNVREAKLELQPVGKWDDTPLGLSRVDGDHNQVKRGTVQHEILEGQQQIAPYMDDEHILLQVVCKPDATENLDSVIPYGLAVTLEVAEGVNIPIYEQIRAKIKPTVAVQI